MAGHNVNIGPLAFTPGGGQAVATGSEFAIPTNSAGERPKYVYVQSEGNTFFVFGVTGMADADSGDTYIRAGDYLICDVSGYTHVRAATAICNVSALENDGGTAV